MSLPREFASDNTATVHPAVLEALHEVNSGFAVSYGDDPWTARLNDWFRKQFGEGTEAFPVFNGTGANVVALRAITRAYDAVICTEHAHIQVDECGAPERIGGCKLIDLASPNGKLTPAQVRAAVKGIGNEHHVQPRAVSISQSTEDGTVYSLAEVTALCATAHELGAMVHMDGARISNAAASLGLPLRAFTRDAGIDILSFGATKNGGMGAEAVVVFTPELASELKFLRKQTTQLASKMRFLSAQLLAMGENDLWLTNATHANAMAQRLAEGVRAIPGITITQSVDANAVFALLPREVTAKLQEQFHFYVWYEETGEVRWMTNWATAPEDVDEFVAAIRQGMSPRA